MNYRPQFHFSARQHWINDPNGLVFINGVYHLFYQCNPFGIEWGNMSWGHATSRDLIHWQEKPIALPQRYLGDRIESIFSGCCVLDEHNVTGLGEVGQVPLLAFYTSHYSQAPEGMGRQAQSLAYSLDEGVTWRFYSDQPLLYLSPANAEGLDADEFRDPKVFYHQPSGYWIMVLVLAVDRKVIFYRSRNLLDWSMLSTFSDPGDNSGDLWEVPDLVEIGIEGTNEHRWVLLLSVNTSGLHKAAGSTQHYFIGDFDGTHFQFHATQTPPVRDEKHPGFNRLDWGRDYYAAVSFHNSPGDEPVVIAWMNNWLYANEVPHDGFRGQMALARRLTLQRDNNGRVGLRSIPVLPERQHIANRILDGKPGNGDIIKRPIETPIQRLTLISKGYRQGQIVLTLGYGGHSLVLTLDADQGSVSLDRQPLCSDHTPATFLASDSAQGLELEDVGVLVVLDHSSVEVFSTDGSWTITQQIFPLQPLDSLSLEYWGASGPQVVVETW